MSAKMKTVTVSSREKLVLALYRSLAHTKERKAIDGLLGYALRKPGERLEPHAALLNGTSGDDLLSFSKAAKAIGGIVWKGGA